MGPEGRQKLDALLISGEGARDGQIARGQTTEEVKMRTPIIKLIRAQSPEKLRQEISDKVVPTIVAALERDNPNPENFAVHFDLYVTEENLFGDFAYVSFRVVRSLTIPSARQD